MASTILVVDDEERLLSLLKAYLREQGFHPLTARNGREALFLARQERPDLIVLDLMMPEMDGLEFLRLHRKERQTPVIILSARVDEADRIVGLELGADDYVVKPFSPRELTARIRAVLRRAGQTTPEPEVLRVHDVTLDRAAHSVGLGQREVNLTPTEFELLAALMRRPGRVFGRAELLEYLQGTSFEGYERTVDVHIKNLRAKLEPQPTRPRYVETVYGVGYRFAREEP